MYKIPANIGFRSNLVYYLPSCHSTNEVAANLLVQQPEEGTVVITDNQTAGKGQRGNSWEAAPYQNLTFTLVLKPNFVAVNQQFKLTQVVSLGIAAALQTHLTRQVKIKWPNDIFVGQQKLAGILIQNNLKGTRLDTCLVGVGINVNQTQFVCSHAASVAGLGKKNLPLNDMLVEVLAGIASYYAMLNAGKEAQLTEEYHQLLLGLGEEMNFKSGREFTGQILGIDAQGRLLIKEENQVHSFQHKEVQFVW